MTGLLRRGVDHDVILGHEISGRIAGLGEESIRRFGRRRCRRLADRLLRTVRPGVRRAWTIAADSGAVSGTRMNGGFAEYVVLPERSVTPIPDGIDLTAAALLACPIGVCVRALAVAGVSAGESVLVTGAGGGLGIHAIQVAGSLGAQVFAATSSAEKLDVLDRFAPGGVILGGELDFSELVLAFTEDAGVDVVVDTVGSAVVSSSIRSLAQYGRMVMLGEVAGGRAAIRLTDIMFRDAAPARIDRGESRGHRDCGEARRTGRGRAGHTRDGTAGGRGGVGPTSDGAECNGSGSPAPLAPRGQDGGRV